MENLAKHNFTNLLVVMTDRHIGNLLVSLYAIKAVQQQLSQQQTICCVIDFHLLPLATYLLPDIEFIPCTIRGNKPSLLKKLNLFISMLYKVRQKNIDTAVDLYGQGINSMSGNKYVASGSK
ncbi:MAG TPA: hypothetical protein ENI05_02510 [Porticoccus sp.]|nr:hypothetical protein [Porticoccus sp.]